MSSLHLLPVLMLAAALALAAAGGAQEQKPPWTWDTASPESRGMDPAKLESLWTGLDQRQTSALLVIRKDRIVFERYAPGASRTTPHYTASLAKALVGGMSLMTAMEDGRLRPDDPASRYVPHWAAVDRKRDITVRHLATHTSGIEDAEEGDLAHDRLSGWKGDFWKQPPPPRDPFTLARDEAPVLDPPGTKARYSNPGMAMLSYCVTAALRGAPDPDLRSLLKHRIMEPLGVPPAQWSCGYGKTVEIDGVSLVAPWGGGSYSPDAAARVGRLLLRGGDWNGHRLLSAQTIGAATTYAGMPNNSGLGWWVNRNPDGEKHWKSAPADAFWGAGAGHQFLLVVPSLGLIAVRFGQQLEAGVPFDDALERHVVAPLMGCLLAQRAAPYPPSPVLKGIDWAPASTIARQARDSDCWPLTWADDGALYTAYGDGTGFEPKRPGKLSLGLARIEGAPPAFHGTNLPAPTVEQVGDGPKGKKASGLLMVDGVLCLWARNAGNSQLAWSSDHGRSWSWGDWKLSPSFGCPAFLNFGRNYRSARDRFVYLYSPDTDSAYLPADRLVLARVPGDRIRDREAYEFFAGFERSGRPRWSERIEEGAGVFGSPGGCYRTQVSYDAPLHRYLMCQVLPGGDARFHGGFGIYDASEPWGPWTTVYYAAEWDVGPGESCSFPPAWMSRDGRTLWLVFSGEDSFSVRGATLRH